MKKIFVTIISFILITVSLTTCVSAKTDKEIKFREIEWGSTLDEVRAKEITPTMVKDIDYVDVDDNSFMLCNQKVAGYNCAIDYEFDENKGFILGGYVLTEKHTNEQDYYTDFMSIIEKLTGIYGRPELNQEMWKGDLYKGQPNKQGMAVITGDLVVLANWMDQRGNEIRAILTGDNYECSSNIIYLSKWFDEVSEDDTSGL